MAQLLHVRVDEADQLAAFEDLRRSGAHDR